MAFALAGDLSSPSVISLKIDIDFAVDGDKICLPIAEVLLCAAAGNLARSPKQQALTPRTAVLLIEFHTEISNVRLPAEYCGFREKFYEEDGVA